LEPSLRSERGERGTLARARARGIYIVDINLGAYDLFLRAAEQEGSVVEKWP